ncbi:hypothetical protein [Nostocoides sp. Soil756]|uniref:hypothetical protein n=1 Tax=Nostocoides sp. Soil756 TaxID=1736399 RepID=UPI0006FEAA4E|nr:hypothetical protein [Tetrasphaera sp. Soil756]KRE60057.1 hypothetical protein ASG78_15155 [Tetrasphaera sp. Soil756]
MTNRTASALRLTGILGATLLASGCAVMSPVQTDQPYIPADGVQLTIPGLELRNLLIVSSGKGAPGVLVGQAVNRSSDTVDVVFAVGNARTSPTAVPALTGSNLGADGGTVDVGTVPVAPGAMVELSVTTPQAGRNVVLVPVLPPTRYYSDLPVPSAGPTG